LGVAGSGDSKAPVILGERGSPSGPTIPPLPAPIPNKLGAVQAHWEAGTKKLHARPIMDLAGIFGHA